MREIRIDGAVIATMWVLSVFSSGTNAWLLAAILVARGVCISFLDYIYHYGTPVGQVLLACNLRLPPRLAVLLLNFNLHGIHHRYPTLPWTELPEVFRQQGAQFDGGYFAAAVRQLRGPIPASNH